MRVAFAMRWSGVVVAAGIGACAGPVEREALPRDHPANPGAPAAVMPGSASIGHPQAGGGEAAAGAAGAVVYTCPMHPEVVSDRPGRCPKCGMELVKRGSGDGGRP